ncbi:MAG TPA: hypothetical protein VFY43_01750, partial [Candidatus Limnocylindria bacterium]|nr:hypothetical protein [Candidatus Limnocylindria bacterium]
PSDGGASRLVTTDVDSPAWSPDGSLIAFTRFNGQQSGIPGDLIGPEIWVVGPDGTGERTIGGRVGDGSRERLSEFIGWAPDGSAISFERAFGRLLNSVELGLVNLAGERNVLRRQHDVSVELLIWAPDGSHLYYLEQAHFTSTLASVGSDGGNRGAIHIADGVPGSLVMAPDGSTMAWGIQGSSDLVLQPVDGSVPTTYQVAPNAVLAWQPNLGKR